MSTSTRVLERAQSFGAVQVIARWVRMHWWVCSVTAMTLLAALTRVPMRARFPFNWDSTQYNLALTRFDISIHQPHPPGNPLYIVLGRALHLVIANPNDALVAVSIIASAVAVAGTALLGARLVGTRLALVASLLLAVNPVFWLYGEVGLSYAPECAIGVIVAMAAWHAYERPNRWAAVALAASIAFAGGLRPTVLPLLGPLFLFGLARMSWRTRGITVAVAVVGCLGWLIPLLWISGGPATYYHQLGFLVNGVDQGTTIGGAPFGRWLRNALTVVMGLGLAFNALAIVAIVAVIRRRPSLRATEARTLLLWLWLLPPVAVFAFVHFGQLGYLLLVLPPGMLLGLLAIRHAWPTMFSARAACLLVALLLVPAATISAAMAPISRAHDASWREVRQEITALPPSQTIVLSQVDQDGMFRILGELLPDYHAIGIWFDSTVTLGALYDAMGGHSTFHLDPNMRACGLLRLDGARSVVITGQWLVDAVHDRSHWQLVPLSSGRQMLVSAPGFEPTYVHFSKSDVWFSNSLDASDAAITCTAGPREPLRVTSP